VRSSVAVPLRCGRCAVAVTCTTTESPKVVELGDTIVGLTLEEARSLINHLQERLSVFAAVTVPSASGADVEEAAPAEKLEFDVIIDEVPSSARIVTVKVVHALKEAKDLIEGLPKKVKEGVTQASLGGADAGEHARGGLHGALERCGTCLLLTRDEQALLAPAQRVAHDLSGAWRHVEHGQSVLQAAEGQLLHDVEHRCDVAHAVHYLLVEEEAQRRRATSEVTLPSPIHSGT
jgi:large subunit ribosomal protein L7/L12